MPHLLLTHVNSYLKITLRIINLSQKTLKNLNPENNLPSKKDIIIDPLAMIATFLMTMTLTSKEI
jgi:hypothetical protein